MFLAREILVVYLRWQNHWVHVDLCRTISWCRTIMHFSTKNTPSMSFEGEHIWWISNVSFHVSNHLIFGGQNDSAIINDMINAIAGAYINIHIIYIHIYNPNMCIYIYVCVCDHIPMLDGKIRMNLPDVENSQRRRWWHEHKHMLRPSRGLAHAG